METINFSCSCAGLEFTKIKPEEIENKRFGSKHFYKCSKCAKMWWSFFWNLATKKRNKFS